MTEYKLVTEIRLMEELGFSSYNRNMEKILTGSNVKLSLGYLLSTALCFNGLQFILYPTKAASEFGIPISPSPSTTWTSTASKGVSPLYLPVLGSRNLASGLAIGTFLYQGNNKAAGTVLCCGFMIGCMDIWACFKHEGGKMGKATWTHFVGNGVFTAVGAWLLFD